jgi:putative membrane protein
MTRSGRWLLLAGTLLFIALVGWHGFGSVLSALSVAGWGLGLVVLYHLLPVVIDAAAMSVLFDVPVPASSLWQSVLTRWVGESVNSLMPAGQLGGPVIMVRQLVQRGTPLPLAAAVVTVGTTYLMLAQMIFALTGTTLLGAHQRSPILLISIAALCAIVASFYAAQRRGMFRSLTGLAQRVFGPGRMASLSDQADALDRSVVELYGRKARGASSLALNLLAWLVGTGEVYLILKLLRAPVTWESALMLESLGQAVRGAAFAVPGSLGVQEGGYLLLAPFAGLSPDVALAMSLAKRAREILLGLPGLLYLHWHERRAGLFETRTPGRTIL